MEERRLARWRLLLLMKEAATDRAHPVETHPLGARLGLSAEETDLLVDDLERLGKARHRSWPAGLATLTPEGERAAETALLHLEDTGDRPPVGFQPGEGPEE